MFCEQIKWIRNLEGSPIATDSSTIIFLCNNRIRCTLLSHLMSYVVPLPRENTRCELKRNTFFNRIHCSNYNLLYNCIYHSLTPPVLSLTLFIPTPLLCFFRHKLRLQDLRSLSQNHLGYKLLHIVCIKRTTYHCSCWWCPCRRALPTTDTATTRLVHFFTVPFACWLLCFLFNCG